MQIYNTLSGKKEKFISQGQKVKLFVCGPTVYDYQHIGNGKTQMVFDLFARYLRSEGYRVFYLQNITDIDDKIILRAKEQNISSEKLADDYLKIYLEDVKSLGITSVNKYARATRYIKQIVRQVKTLLDKGYAYKTDDGYYFDISKFSDYGKLSHRTTEQAEDGVSRIDESVKKRNRGDFALWKLWSGEKHEPYWNTSLGNGRPGWHIEDTAITEKFFGPQYDVHGGGLDLKFPHHEAELAQQEAASGKKPFVRFWMHSGLVSINGQKMSKSLGNFITIRDFLKKCSSETFRYIVFMHHYRAPINYSDALRLQAEESLKTIKEFVGKLEFIKLKNAKKKIDSLKTISDFVPEIDKRFKAALEDDFNTPNALAAVFDLISMIQGRMWGLNPTDASLVIKSIVSKFDMIGIQVKPAKISGNAAQLAKLRDKSRVNKQFMQSDTLRKEIEALGYRVEDTPLGQLIISNF